MISLIIDQYDKGQITYLNNHHTSLVPTTPLPDAIYIPARLIYNPKLNDACNNNSLCDDLIKYYVNSIKFLDTYFHKFCSTIDSISKIMSVSSSIYFNNGNKVLTNSQLLLHASFELVIFVYIFFTK